MAKQIRNQDRIQAGRAVGECSRLEMRFNIANIIKEISMRCQLMAYFIKKLRSGRIQWYFLFKTSSVYIYIYILINTHGFVCVLCNLNMLHCLSHVTYCENQNTVKSNKRKPEHSEIKQAETRTQ